MKKQLLTYCNRFKIWFLCNYYYQLYTAAGILQ